MSAGAVVMVSAGAVTPVGLSAAETAVSVRARTMRFVESDLRDKRFQPFTLATIPDDALPPLEPALEREQRATARERRMVRLAARALRECLAALSTRAPASPLPLCLSLPEMETLLPIDGKAFLQRLALQAGGIDPQASDATHRGRAGGLIAAGQGVAAVKAGIAPFVLAGGVDTYRDLWILGALDRLERVKSEINRDGFVPGEGAAFVLLTSDDVAARQGLPILARLSPVASAFEPGHLESTAPYRGDGLSAAFGQLVASGSVEQPISEVFSSMNGESHWAKEWGVSYLRHRAVFDSSHGMHHPADCYGDLGAAAGPTMLALAALGARDRYRRTPALVYGSSDGGARAAMVVSSVH